VGIGNILADEIVPANLGGGTKEFVVDKVQEVGGPGDARLGEIIPRLCLEKVKMVGKELNR